MKKYKLFLLLLAVLTSGNCHAQTQTIQTYENGPIHEAFVTPSSGRLLLDSIAEQPPEDIAERIPRQNDMQSEWVSGYWHWDFDLHDFVWVSGVWRRPPPGHQWIIGFWKSFEEEWVWIPGYWSKTAPENADYIGVAPPDPIDENMGPPPSGNYFWNPGHWFFLYDKNDYQWVPGHWEELDPNWVFIPSHYTWRPGGYVYISAYWDWTLEERGTAYSAVIIDPDYRYQIVFEPILVLKPEMIIRRLFVHYPDYLTVVHHNYHYHQDYWNSFCCSPPWWSWDTWWALSWHDHWGLWWWYTHPDYPQPYWMTKEISGILPTPISQLLTFFEHVQPPFIVTPNGVVTQSRYLLALNKVTESFLPIVPDERRVLRRVETIASPVSIDPTNRLRPLGRRLPIDPNAVRPNVRKPVINPKALTRAHIVKEQLRPRVPFKPRIPSHKGSPIWKPGRRVHEVESPVRRPTWAPKSPRTYAPYHPESRNKPVSGEHNRPWKPAPEWGYPPIQRPPVHRSNERWHDRSRESKERYRSGERRRGETPSKNEVTRPGRANVNRSSNVKVEYRREEEEENIKSVKKWEKHSSKKRKEKRVKKGDKDFMDDEPSINP